MADINLIPLEEKAQERAEQLQKRMQFASIGLLVFTAIVTLITLVIYTSSVAKKNNLIAQVDDASAKINQYKSQEELLVVSKDKAAAADKLLAARTDFSSVFKKLATVVPQGVYFTDLRITDAKVVISGKAKTSPDVAGLVSALVSAGGSDIIRDVTIDSLSSDEFGIYAFVISGKLVVGKQ